MKKKLLFSKATSIIVAISLTFLMCIVPKGNIVYAEEPDITLEEVNPSDTENSNKEWKDEKIDDVVSDDVAIKEEDTISETTDDTDIVDADLDTENVEDTEEENFEVRLLYGDANLADEDALVLVFMGDGFTKNDIATFWEYATDSARYTMTVSPWDEFADTIKIYGIGVISNESGVKGDKAANYAEAQVDTRDTYFGTSYWYGGTQRMMELGKPEKIAEVEEKCGIKGSDSDILFVNCTVEGGTTYGKKVILSIDKQVNDCTVHELGHSIGNLADEYWSSAGERANKTAILDPLKWSRFVGLNGIGAYAFGTDGDGKVWYRPSQGCKMQLLKNDFCEVCKEALRDKIAEASNVTRISFQTYADQFYEEETGPDMSEYFIFRKGSKKATGKDLDGEIQLIYKDSIGNEVNGTPNKAGDYTVTAVFDGNEDFDACKMTGSYTIQLPDLIDIEVASKEYDGTPVNMSYTVKDLNEEDYTAKVTYTGKYPYSKDPDATTQSTEAPRLQGNYTVTVEIFDKKTDEIISRKSVDFEIYFKTIPIIENSDKKWPGSSSSNSNFTYYIYGDGYTAEEEDKFIEDATEFVKNFLLQEPYREMSSYFNFYAVPTVSETSGISTDGDTYFGLSYDENGKIIASKGAGNAAKNISYDKLDPYYRTAFVIVNDKNVKEGYSDCNGDDKHGAVFTTIDEKGAAYAATEAMTVFMRYIMQDPDYVATAENLEEQKEQFLEWLAYSKYTMILVDTYNGEFIENGEPVDITNYLHTYNQSKLIPNDMIEYDITYYADENGKVGEELGETPSKAGTYHAFVALKSNYTTSGGYGMVENDKFVSELGLSSNRVYVTKAWATFTINPDSSENTDKPAEPETIKVKSIKLSGISHKITAGKKIKLKATISPVNASNKNIVWSTSNSKYATVKNGVVTTMKAGAGKIVKITAKSADGAAIVTYTIKIMKGAVKKIAISGSKSVKAGKSIKLKAKVTTTKGTANKKVKWTSSNTKYATVSSTGKVKASKSAKGKKVTITATATDGSGKKKSVTIKIK